MLALKALRAFTRGLAIHSTACAALLAVEVTGHSGVFDVLQPTGVDDDRPQLAAVDANPTPHVVAAGKCQERQNTWNA